MSVASVQISPSSLTVLEGESQTLKATPLAAGGDVLSGRSVTWSSDVQSVATVDAAGTVEGVTAGQTTVRATVGGVTGTASVTVLKGQSIVLSSASVSLTAVAGGSSGTQIDTVTNGGNGLLSGLSASVAYAQGPTGWLTATLDDTIAPAHLSIAASAALLAAGSYTATVTVASPVRGGLSAQVAVTLQVAPGPPDVALTKTGPATATAGAQITYALAVAHVGGTIGATGVVVKDSLPAQLTFSSATGGGTYDATTRTVTWNVGSLAVGGSTSLGLTAQVGSGVSGAVRNTATVSTTSTDPNPANDTSSVTTTVGQAADLSVAKTGPATAIAGTQITDTIRVHHVGGTSDASGVVVTDTLPAALTFVSATSSGTYSATTRAVTWSVGTVAVGDSAILAVTATVGPGVSGSVSNRAWVGSTSADPVSANDSSTAVTTVTQTADLSVTKTAPAAAVAGGQVTDTIRVRHVSGTSDASGVVVADTLPTALTFVSATNSGAYDGTTRAVTWNVGPVSVGDSAILAVTAMVGPAVTGTVNNTATVTSTSTDPVASNDTSTATMAVVQGADLSVTKTAPATAVAGTQVVDTIRVRHVGGTSDASGVVVTDTLPTALTFVSATGGGAYNATSRAVTWNVGTVAVGDSAVLAVTATVGPAVSGAVSNTATVSTTSTDPNTANNTSTATTTVGQTADLSLAKTAPATAIAGAQITDTIRVRHVGGTSDASGVVVTDPLPSSLTFVSATGGGTASGGTVTWNVGTVAVGDSAILTVTATVGPGVTGTVSNTATVSSTSTDPVTSNNTATATTAVSQSADVAVTKTASDTAVAGAQINYTITVSHAGGTSDASGVVVTDALPSSLTFVSATGPYAYNATTRTVTWSVGTLAVGVSDSLGLSATVGAGVSGSVSNTATVSSTSTDPNTANNSSTLTTTVVQGADVAVTKTGPATATAGGPINYTITVSHVGGTSDASGVTVVDTLPSSLAYVSSTGGTSSGAVGQVVTWNVGTLAVGASKSLGLAATVGSGVSGTVSNRATVSSTSTDPNAANDTSTFTTTVGQTADLKVLKTGPTTATAGTSISYTIGVSYVGGTSDASGVMVTDTLPTGLTYTGSTGGTSSGAVGQVVTWSVGTLAVGGSASLGLTVTVAPSATGTVSNRAWVRSAAIDPVLTNDSSTVATTVSQSADLAVTNTGPATDTAGTQVSYTIGVNNTLGPSDASTVRVTDTLP
ncbi:MAG: DUF11 domain-containing protein, partial [Gemmatimonadetes bacterium]|nr:DUF11 domain-containing protein [Gemmatimonadota bacterium]